MALWQITSYRTAVDTELQLRHAITLLRMRYGRRWRRHAPASLVWMLRTGIAVEEAYLRVQALVDVDDAAKIADGLPSQSASTAAVDAGSSNRCLVRRIRRWTNSAKYQGGRPSRIPAAIASPRRCG